MVVAKSNHWLKKAEESLLSQSENQIDFVLAKREWVYKGVKDLGDVLSNCQLCGHDIRYEHYIKNSKNDHKMTIGSTCIQQFLDNTDGAMFDGEGNEITSTTIKEALHKLFLDQTLSALNKYYLKQDQYFDMHKKVYDAISSNKAITPNQAWTLYFTFDKYNDEDKRAMAVAIKIRLRRARDKEQMESLTSEKRNFIGWFLSAQQADKYDIDRPKILNSSIHD